MALILRPIKLGVPTRSRCRSEQGRYHDLYPAFAAAVRGEGRQPIPASDAVRTLAVLDAARLSAETEKQRRGATPVLHV
jgi:hypothetical protein